MYKNKIVVVFEGPDGSGKSTQIEMLEKYLLKQGIPFTKLKARVKSKPIYRHLCEIEDRVNALGSDEPFPKWLKSAIIAFVRAAQIIEGLNENEREEIVLIDKYVYSTPLYLEHLGIDNKYATLILESLPSPDIVFLFKLDPDICLERIKNRGGRINKNETAEFLNILNNDLEKEIKSRRYGKLITLDAQKDKDALFSLIVKEIHECGIKA